MMMRRTWIVAAVVALGACGAGDDGPPEIDFEGCEHLEGGPFQALTAGAARDASAPEVDDDHVGYRVTGPGFVRFGATEAGDYVFFYDTAATVEYTGSDGIVVAPEDRAASSPACDTIRQRDTVPMTVGTYYLELGAGVATMVIEHAGDDH
jgi:hypothetical protein